MREGVSIPPDPPLWIRPWHLYLLFSAIYIVVFKIVSYEVWKLFICIIIGKLICSGNAGVSRACMAFVLVIDVHSGKNVLSLKDFSYLLF